MKRRGDAVKGEENDRRRQGTVMVKERERSDERRTYEEIITSLRKWQMEKEIKKYSE